MTLAQAAEKLGRFTQYDLARTTGARQGQVREFLKRHCRIDGATRGARTMVSVYVRREK